jgi:hypothetical protein
LVAALTHGNVLSAPLCMFAPACAGVARPVRGEGERPFQHVALKLKGFDTHPGEAVDAADGGSFASEYSKGASLRHDHVVNVLGVCDVPIDAIGRGAGGRLGGAVLSAALPAIVMELLPLSTECVLEPMTWVHDHARAATRLRLLWAWQAASGLAYMHEQNVVHRDLKPNNMRLTAAGVLKLTDFGISVVRIRCELTTDNPANKSASFKGSPAYANPALLVCGPVGAVRHGSMVSNSLIPHGREAVPAPVTDAPTLWSGAGAMPDAAVRPRDDEAARRLFAISRANDCFGFACCALNLLTHYTPWSGVVVTDPTTYTILGRCASQAGDVYSVVSPFSRNGDAALRAAIERTGCPLPLADEVMAALRSLLWVSAGESAGKMATVADLLLRALWAGVELGATADSAAAVGADAGADVERRAAPLSIIADAAKFAGAVLREQERGRALLRDALAGDISGPAQLDATVGVRDAAGGAGGAAPGDRRRLAGGGVGGAAAE